MKRLFVIAAALLAVTGCSMVTSSEAPNSGATGDVWFTVNTGLGAYGQGLFLSSRVYYCSPPNGSEAAICRPADFHR